MTFTPTVIAEKGEQIYRDKYKARLESSDNGKFVAIDVSSEEAFIDATPEGALQKGKSIRPSGAFHLIKIGSPGVFRVGYAGRQRGDWIFQ